MSGKFVRASKFRHVYGQAAKKERCYENLKVTKNAWDSNLIDCNGKYISVTWESSGGGAFAVIPVDEVGKAPDTVPLFRGHKGPVLDTAFNPFNSQQIASCSDDGQVLIWEIPEDFSFHNYRDDDDNLRDVVAPVKTLKGHTRKVGHVGWHPCAANVLASSSADYTVKLWNTDTGIAELSLKHPDLVTSFAFNYNGSLLATAARDKRLRIWDIRTGKIVQEGASHTGAKASRVVWFGNTDRICTTGFSRLSDRQVGVWDVNDLEKGPLGGFLVVDSASGVLVPIFDDATSILYLAGKGDGNIRYYEYDASQDFLHDLSQYASTDAQRGFAAAPKTFVNMRENEVLRAFKTVNDHAIEPVSFIVPRKSELFQHDIYPDAPSDQPALTAEEWFGGKDVNGPLLVPMEAIYEGQEPEVRASSPAVSVSERRAETAASTPVKKEVKRETAPRKEAQKEAKSPSPSPASSRGSVDEVLKSSGKVDSLLSKVVDESDDEDSKRIEESKDQDEDWEEVKKPAEKSTESERKEEAKAAKEIKTALKTEEPKKEPKKEPEAIAEVAPKAETKANTKAESKSEVKTEPKPEAKAEAAPPSTSASTTSKAASSAGQPTLRATVDKLASIVDALEKQVETLISANVEKNDKIDSLEKKIDELLSR